jgi:hypothetical protein
MINAAISIAMSGIKHNPLCIEIEMVRVDSDASAPYSLHKP